MSESVVVSLRWEHLSNFASLMVGRIELAQITLGRATTNWFFTLYFTQGDERPSFSAPTEAEAKYICEEHARKVLAVTKGSFAIEEYPITGTKIEWVNAEID